MTYLVTARKWRPMRFDEVTAQEHVTITIKNSIRSNRIAHAYLFSGPSGVGKTTTARILAKAINCPNVKEGEPCNECDVCREITEGRSLDVIEIDGASNRGIDEIRDLRESVRYLPSSLRYKVYIIDEVHMLTKEAFNALLKTLEEPPPYAIFILATTEPHRVLPTIMTRCQRFDFRRIEIEMIMERLRYIAAEEKIKIDEESLVAIAKKSDGSMRDALSIFDQVVAFCGSEIRHDSVIEALSLVDEELFFKMTSIIVDRDFNGAILLASEIFSRGYDIVEFLNGLAEHLRNLLIVCSTKTADLLEASNFYKQRYLDAAKAFDTPDLLRLLKVVTDAVQQIRYVSQPRIKLEMTLLQLVNMEKSISLDLLFQEIEMLKKKLTGSQLSVSDLPGSSFNNIGLEEKAIPHQRKHGLLPSHLSKTNLRPDRISVHEATFQEINARWDELLLNIKKERIAVWTQMLNVKPKGMGNGFLLLSLPDEGTLLVLRQFKRYLEDAIQKFLGLKVAVEFSLEYSGPRDDGKAGYDEMIIKILKDDFGAEEVE
ncbi:MAG: DNA polymerase III subunit gamma/tau [Candidatus Kryptoniota bacterium]